MVEPKKFGRALGIGVRVASNLVRERAGQVAAGDGRSQAAPQAAGSVRGKNSDAPETSSPRSFGAVDENVKHGQEKAWAAARARAQKTRGVGYGAKRFGQAVWGPLTHAGSVLWLEVTGLFFALFALFFAQNLYRIRGAWKQGPEHSHFLLYCAITLIFFWFSSSSFLRAYKRNKRSR
jgi:hypothetical protein